MNRNSFDTFENNSGSLDSRDATCRSEKSGLRAIRQTMGSQRVVDRYEKGAILVGRYLVDDVLGVGGFGIVYKCQDLQNGKREVAVKTLRHSIADYDRAAKRFEREIELSRSLTNSHTIHILNAGVTDDQTLFFVMELLHGKALESSINEKRYTFYETKRIILQVLESLREAHEKGIVHRDIKPSNIQLEPDPEGRPNEYDVRVLDFGIAKSIDSHNFDDNEKLTQTGAWVGSPSYMSPELLRDGYVTPAVDVYAVGLIMLEMISGHTAVYGNSVMDIAVQQMSPEPHEIDDWILASSMAPIIKKCIDKDYTRRYQNAGELYDVIAALPDDQLRNEYMECRNKSGRRSTVSTPELGRGMGAVSQTGAGSGVLGTLDSLTLASPLSEEDAKNRRILMGIIVGIVMLVIIMFVTLFVKFYMDKLMAKSAETVLSSQEKAMLQGASLGALTGAGRLYEIEIICSFSPDHAVLYRASDNKELCKSGGSFHMILSPSVKVNGVVKAEPREITEDEQRRPDGAVDGRRRFEEYEDYNIVFKVFPQTVSATLAKKRSFPQGTGLNAPKDPNGSMGQPNEPNKGKNGNTQQPPANMVAIKGPDGNYVLVPVVEASIAGETDQKEDETKSKKSSRSKNNKKSQPTNTGDSISQPRPGVIKNAVTD